jgi:5-methylcytosine-specific restriction endonuclease McrA
LEEYFLDKEEVIGSIPILPKLRLGSNESSCRSLKSSRYRCDTYPRQRGGSMLNSEVLVLNSGYIPIRISDVRTSIGLLFQDKAVSVIEEDKYIRSPSISIRVPSVISLLGFNELPKRKVTFSRLNVIYRDDMHCMFCGKRFSITDLTIDHIIPRSRWNKKEPVTQWSNVVCSCKWCNRKKGSKLLSELGWKLVHVPYEPEYMPYLIISKFKAVKRGWLDFCKVNVRLIETL